MAVRAVTIYCDWRDVPHCYSLVESYLLALTFLCDFFHYSNKLEHCGLRIQFDFNSGPVQIGPANKNKHLKVDVLIPPCSSPPCSHIVEMNLRPMFDDKRRPYKFTSILRDVALMKSRLILLSTLDAYRRSPYASYKIFELTISLLINQKRFLAVTSVSARMMSSTKEPKKTLYAQTTLVMLTKHGTLHKRERNQVKRRTAAEEETNGRRDGGFKQ